MESSTICISIRDKIASYAGKIPYVCGNSDYVITFDFDAEWDAYATKTARFVKDDTTYQDQVFSGNQCPVPVISNTYGIRVGVFAGDLHTTTPAYIPAKKSILCAGGIPADPAPDVYAQIMDTLNGLIARIAALENGGAVMPDQTSAALDSAILDKMVLA